jgi:hypothetical protein
MYTVNADALLSADLRRVRTPEEIRREAEARENLRDATRLLAESNLKDATRLLRRLRERAR